MHESNAIHIQRSSRAGAKRTFRLEMIKQNEIKVLLMANVHGGNLHHIYADTEILSAILLIILSMARRLYLVYFRINGKHLLVQNITILTRQF